MFLVNVVTVLLAFFSPLHLNTAKHSLAQNNCFVGINRHLLSNSRACLDNAQELCGQPRPFTTSCDIEQCLAALIIILLSPQDFTLLPQTLNFQHFFLSLSGNNLVFFYFMGHKKQLRKLSSCYYPTSLLGLLAVPHLLCSLPACVCLRAEDMSPECTWPAATVHSEPHSCSILSWASLQSHFPLTSYAMTFSHEHLSESFLSLTLPHICVCY